MKISTVSKLSAASFPDQQKWIGRLLGPLNGFMTNVFLALNKRLTFADNMLGQENLLTFTYQANTLPLNFLVTMSTIPLNLTVCSAFENNKPVILQMAWQYTNAGQVQITDIVKLSGGAASALITGANYHVRVRVQP